MPGAGIIRTFARHPTAANLLMVIMIVAGLFALNRINTQFFPNFAIDIVHVSVKWPGASAGDVDASIVQALEPEVRFIDGVKRVRSTSIEGLASLIVEFEPGSDIQAALADVETAVGQVTTLPNDSEPPIVKRILHYDNITRLAISGPYPEAALKAFAKRIRNDLLSRGIDKVDMVGARGEEIWVEVQPATLRRLDLTLGDIADRIAETSRDLPAGDTRGSSEMQIRSLGLVKTARDLGHVEIRSLPSGERIYLRDVARVSERFEDGDITVHRKGDQAIELHVQRAVTADALELADTVDAYLDEVRPTLPANLEIVQYEVAADLIRSRRDLLLRNGLGGLILVVGVLFIFLDARVAFWVAAGIPLSLLATIAVMLVSGQTINMVSMFGLIMALGIVVDDAIVVGEHAAMRFRNGESALDAAEGGARRMAAPVFCSSLTTIAAFMPLFLISDILGEIIRAIPFVVVAVIVASLIECFLVLPGHLHGALSKASRTPNRWRVWFRRNFDHFRDKVYRPLVRRCLKERYVTLATALAALVLCVGLVMGGRVGFVFFPSAESDWIDANLQLVAGSPRSSTLDMLEELDRALYAAEAKLTDGAGGLVKLSIVKVGTTISRETGAVSGDHTGGLVVELASTDDRDISSAELIAAWREEIMVFPGVETLNIFVPVGGPPGREIDLRLAGDDAAELKLAVTEVKALLGRYPGISDIEDDLPYGKLEAIFEVNARGRSLGFTTTSLARQLRDAFEGKIAMRFPRGDEEVLVRVQYPRDVIGAAALDTLFLRAPNGAEVALSSIADRRETRGFARIKRQDGARQAAIIAEIDENVTSSDAIIDALWRDGLADIAARHGARAFFAGKAEEQAQTLGDMRIGAAIGLVTIYIVLAWVFASYTRPFVVMSVIPLGFVGAVLGHWLMGFDLTIMSMVALVGLSGIVVNDSIILVTTIDERRARGEPLYRAIVDGSCDRLRAVILTSATTMGGLTPLMFETSLQAQFLIPMAVTIVFGLMVTTFLVLLVVPALIAIQGDFGRLHRRLRRRLQPGGTTPAKSAS